MRRVRAWRFAVCAAALAAPGAAAAPVYDADDPELVQEAARAVEEAELAWGTLRRGCVSDVSPLTVTLEYRRPDGSTRAVEAYRPWRTGGWRVRDEADAAPCDDRPRLAPVT